MFNFKTADGKQQVDVCRLPLTRCLTLGRTNKAIPHRGTRGGGGLMESLPWVFAVFQYLGENLPLVESFLCAQQDEVYIMG